MRDTWQDRCKHSGKLIPHKNVAINYNHIANYAGDPLLKDINNKKMRGVLTEIRADRGSSNATLNRILSTLTTIYSQCSLDEYVDAVPKFQRYKEEGHRKTFYERDHVEIMSEYARQSGRIAMADAIEVLAWSGMRVGTELLVMRAWDVDLRNDCFLIGGTPETRTKGRNFRRVPIHKNVRSIVERRAKGVAGNTPLFDEFTNYFQFRREFAPCFRALQREHDHMNDELYFIHTLRHSFGTWMVAAGIPIAKVQQWMGHSSVKVTEGYTHNVTTGDSQLMDGVD